MTAGAGLSRPVRRIGVLRGGGLGDLVFAVPALRALAARFGDAELVVIGHSWQAGVVGTPRGPVDRVIDLPKPVVEWLAGGPQPPRLDALVAQLEGRFDLLVQLHGGGARSNVLLRRLGAGRAIGLQAPGAPPLDATTPYRYWQSEVMRDLEVVSLVGAEAVEIEPRLTPTAADVVAGRRILDDADAHDGRSVDGPLVILAPGATDGRRRWPPERFGEVAAALSSEGYRPIVIGTAPEAALAEAVVSVAPETADLTGRLTLPELAGLLCDSALIVGNDSGPLHLAAAVGTPAVGLFWCGNLINAGRAFRARYHPLLSWRLECIVCGANTMTDRCGHDASFVADIETTTVLDAARDLLAA
ncbi:MAG TPA: glycosyltransferase family 9 protein [Candidatus Limnocylindrales bacterium]|nr:glycosyltransferase family 9 protein [Candidatus Limnocylindrales bacterium]